MLYLRALALSLLSISGLPRQVSALPNTVYSKHKLDSESHYGVIPSTSNTTWPLRSYKSSQLKPPDMAISGNGKPLAPGYIFITPNNFVYNSSANPGANYIVTSTGDLVYGQDITESTDFRVQEYNGKRYLTYWTGFVQNGMHVGRYGNVTFVDEQYNTFVFSPNLHLNKGIFQALAPNSVDAHEHQLTPRNTILISAYNNTPADLSSVGGPKNGWIQDSLVVELDIATNKVLFLWRASDHVPVTASKVPLLSACSNGTEAAPWDFFHLNSIQAVGENYLINSRDCWTTFFVSKNGTILWEFEGETGGSFGSLPSDGTFRLQHHVRAHNVTPHGLDISIFDDHNAPNHNTTIQSKPLLYHLELPPKKSYRPQLKRRLVVEGDAYYVGSQGSYQPTLSNGNQFVGYGQIAVFREFGPGSTGGDLRLQAQFGVQNVVQSYRSFKETWVATPKAWDPSLVVQNGSAYVSWNGATEVTDWNVYSGTSQKTLKLIGTASKKGFETTFKVPKGCVYMQVGAIQHGKEMRKSNSVKV